MITDQLMQNNLKKALDAVVILQVNIAVDAFHLVVVHTKQLSDKGICKVLKIAVAKKHVIVNTVLFLLLILLPLISQVNILLHILSKLIIRLHTMNLLNIDHQVLLNNQFNLL